MVWKHTTRAVLQDNRNNTNKHVTPLDVQDLKNGDVCLIQSWLQYLSSFKRNRGMDAHVRILTKLAVLNQRRTSMLHFVQSNAHNTHTDTQLHCFSVM